MPNKISKNWGVESVNIVHAYFRSKFQFVLGKSGDTSKNSKKAEIVAHGEGSFRSLIFLIEDFKTSFTEKH